MRDTKHMNVFGEATKVLEAEGRKTPALGIDLGTTNSAIALIRAGNTPEVITLKNGAKTMPSCVMWKGPKGGFIVGKEAYDNRYKPSSVYSVKRLMGQDVKVTMRYGPKSISMSPEEVSAEILKGLVEQASELYKDIKDVVITVPAYFDVNQVTATKKAGEMAGLNVMYIMREPTAASLCYQTDFTGRRDEKILVYDLGGGTFDVSVLRISKGGDLGGLSSFYGIDDDKSGSLSNVIYTVLDTDGDSHLGGDDVDKELYKILEQRISDLGHDVTAIPKVEKEKLILRLEKLKKRMKDEGSACSVNVSFKLKNGKAVKTMVELSERDFWEAARVVYLRTKSKVNAVLSRTDVKEISSIALVGGSTKSPFIREMLKKDFPNVQMNYALNPDESVALGAAIKAKECKFGDTKTEVFDILPMAIGVLSDGVVTPVIPKNQAVPYTAVRYFSTVEDNQKSIEVPVYQGLSPVKEECLFLGMIPLDDLPDGKAGEVGVKVSMTVDTNGILVCSVTVGDKTRSVELVNLFGNQTKKDITLTDKRIIKWKAFADRLSGEGRQEVLDAVENFQNGVWDAAKVSEVISKFMSRKEVVKPVTKIYDIDSEE